jgi:hypothetical protein
LLYEGFLPKLDPGRTYWININKSIEMSFDEDNFSRLFPGIESKTTIYFVRHGEGFHNTVKGWKKLTAPRKLLTDAFLVSSQNILKASTAIQSDINTNYKQGLSTLGLFSSPLRRCIETLYLILNEMFPGKPQPPQTSSSSSSSQVQQLNQIAEKIIIIPCSGEVNSSKTCDKGLWPSSLENKSICTALTCTTYEDLFRGQTIKIKGQTTTDDVDVVVVDLLLANKNLQKVTIDWSMFFNVGKEECKTKMLTQFIGKAFTEEQTPRRGNKTQFLKEQVLKYIQELPELPEQVKSQLLITEDKITFPERDKNGKILKPEDIYDMVWNAIPSNPNSRKDQNFVEWMKCDKKKHCDSAALHYLWRIERESTIYMLRILNMGYISKDDTRPLIINIYLGHGDLNVKDATLTGIWSEDYHNVKVELASKGDKNTFVLASGPTGAGKTFMGKKICEKLDLPSMISIDGGIYRDCSIVYQIIKHVLHEKGWAGMRNLVFTSTLEKIHSVPRLLRISWTKFFEGIFDTEKVKNLVYQYLVFQRKIQRRKESKINFPIYVPDTLSFTPSMNDYKDFLALTGYQGEKTEQINIINAMIYQHWEGGEKCPLLNPQNKCEGCLASGRKREIREGKKYPDNPDSYNAGVKNSLAVLFDESNEFTTRIFIHNTGSPEPLKESLWYQYSTNYSIVLQSPTTSI